MPKHCGHTRARRRQKKYEELEIGYAPAPTVAIIAGILRRYHELAPGAPVTLHDLSLSEILTGLKGKKLHAGLTLRPRPGEMRGLKFQVLRRFSVGIICAEKRRSTWNLSPRISPGLGRRVRPA